jgi:formate/nitrite transporter FocA (FNT family)
MVTMTDERHGAWPDRGRTSARDACYHEGMSQKKKSSPVTLAIAGGLFCGLGASIIVPSFTKALDTSQELTVLVIAIGFLVGSTITYLVARPR